jgi:putative transposase
MLILKKRGGFLELPLELYEDGIKKVKLMLLELHPEFDYIIDNVYLTLLVKKEIYIRKKESLIVESVPKNKLTILKDKKNFIDPITLTMSWLKILGVVLTLKEKDCCEFWNSRCEENSKKLWFPTGTDYVDLRLNSLSGFSTKTIQNSWFSTKQIINPLAKNSPKTFSPSFTYSHVEKWEKDAIRVIKVKLNPTIQQEQILKKWAGTVRYVYNKILNLVKLNPELNKRTGFIKLCKDCITKKDNNIIKEGDTKPKDKFLYDWELETPKDIRKGALRDVEKAFKTAWANLKAGNINSFGLKPRTKKEGTEQSMEIPPNAIKIVRKKNKIIGFSIYNTFINNVIKIHKSSLKKINLKEINMTVRLKRENNIWYLCIPYKARHITSKLKSKTAALDPGIRDFMTLYSEKQIIHITPDFNKLDNLYEKLDKLKEKRNNRKISRKNYTLKRCKIQERINNLVNDLHYKTITFLTKKYTSILLPSFETQEMVGSKKLNKKTKRYMNTFAFHKFKQRLIHKCSIIKNCNVDIVNEAYTSQTCGMCGNLKKTTDKIITCDKCKITFDRDINGARNIYLKYMSK